MSNWVTTRACALLASVWLFGCTEEEPGPAGPIWTPEVSFDSPATGPRGLLDRRGLIHAHSVYSHDACDGEPVTEGVYDPVCFDDFRRGLCQSRHDFVMLTDHDDSFGDNTFPDVLLYRGERGDQLVERDGVTTASWAACPDGRKALIMAGFEAGTMAVGLEGHAATTDAERRTIYRAATSTAVRALHAQGAVVLAQHTEDWTVEQLSDLPIDGFEMYNLHANTLRGAGAVLELLFLLSEKRPGLPHPDLAFVPIINEDSRYLDTWAKVLAGGSKRVGTMGTDCHRNTFEAILGDGERVDSYRRMMRWFSNHLLVTPDPDGTWTDAHLKASLRAGRLYGVFEVFGFAEGFDFVAVADGATYEMGDTAPLGKAPKLVVKQPRVRGLDPDRPAPKISTRLLRATSTGWVEAGSSDGDLELTPTEAGAYRAEIRIRPDHLRADLGQFTAAADADLVWIYANPIYVR